LPPKDLVRGPVCWEKMEKHLWKPWKHAFWPPPECQGPFSMLPRHALSSVLVWNAGVGLWRAATAEISQKSQVLVRPYEHRLIRQTSPDELYYELSHSDLRVKAPKKQMRPQTVPVVNRTFPCHMGVRNQTFTTDPGPSPK
jgi:hypothetical protein